MEIIFAICALIILVYCRNSEIDPTIYFYTQTTARQTINHYGLSKYLTRTSPDITGPHQTSSVHMYHNSWTNNWRSSELTCVAICSVRRNTGTDTLTPSDNPADRPSNFENDRGVIIDGGVVAPHGQRPCRGWVRERVASSRRGSTSRRKREGWKVCNRTSSDPY